MASWSALYRCLGSQSALCHCAARCSALILQLLLLSATLWSITVVCGADIDILNGLMWSKELDEAWQHNKQRMIQIMAIFSVAVVAICASAECLCMLLFILEISQIVLTQTK